MAVRRTVCKATDIDAARTTLPRISRRIAAREASGYRFTRYAIQSIYGNRLTGRCSPRCAAIVPVGEECMGKRILIVDLNNFALYPSIAIGYLTAVLKIRRFRSRTDGPPFSRRRRACLESLGRPGGAGSTSNFAIGPAFREIGSFETFAPVTPPTIRRSSRDPGTRSVARLRSIPRSWLRCRAGVDVPDVFPALRSDREDLPRTWRTAAYSAGPISRHKDVARQWIDIPGLSALVGGEVEPHLCELVERLIERQPTDDVPGCLVAQRRGSRA